MQIHYLLMDNLRSLLQQRLIDAYPDTDPIKADIVKIGMFQENPTRDNKNISVWIQTGDPNDINSFDGVVTTNSTRRTGMEIPPYEIGGRSMWYRTTTATFGVYFVKSAYTEEQAAQLATDFYGRLISACREFSISGVTDDFGETASTSRLMQSRLFETGGIKKNTFIWRGYARMVTVTML